MAIAGPLVQACSVETYHQGIIKCIMTFKIWLVIGYLKYNEVTGSPSTDIL